MTRVLVLGSAAVMGRGLYDAPLARRGIGTVACGMDERAQVSSWIDEVKRQGSLSNASMQAAGLLVEDAVTLGAEVVVLACTELGSLAAWPMPIPCIDSNLELARATLEQAGVGARIGK